VVQGENAHPIEEDRGLQKKHDHAIRERDDDSILQACDQSCCQLMAFVNLQFHTGQDRSLGYPTGAQRIQGDFVDPE
jgi:hypothetical protein